MTEDQGPGEPYYGAPSYSTSDWTSGPLIPDQPYPASAYPAPPYPAPAYPAQPYPAPAYPAPTYPAPPYPPDAYLTPPATEPTRRRRGRVLLGAAATAVVLIGGGGAAYAYTALSGGGTQPERVLPQDTLAFAKIDLDPAAGQKIAAYRLSQHFSSVTNGASNIGGVEDSLLGRLFHGSDLDFATDIKPWLGDRAAVAAVPDTTSEAGIDPVLAVAYTDKAKMTATLTKQAGQSTDFGFVVDRGYVLISDSQAHADALLPRIRKATLADNTTYTSDEKTLHGDQIATAWADLGALGKTLANGQGASLFGNQLFGGALPTMSGREILGVHANAAYLELTGHQLGVPAAAGTAVDDTLSKLPADTSVAVQSSGLGARLAKAYGLVQSSAGFDPFQGLLNSTDLQLPSDLATVFGTQTTLSLKANSPTDPISYAVQAETNDAFRAEHVISTLADGFGVRPQTIDTTDHGYVVASDDVYAKSVTDGSGSLGTSPAFTKAVPHATGAVTVAYVDVAGLLADSALVPDQDRARWADVQALGVSINGTDLTVRLTTK